ncbi:hypothetical protein ARNL5_00878 [Anaerolineae bacterium]|nr:hypothetical protein [Anaerolinea sp.]MCC6975769.1 hypothetical protein [Anaerolineae bacterium]CAG0960607.1 hypothetical protein ARNL5_00878 [Anaerolineae bacterium]
MPAKVNWYETDRILLYVVSAPLTLIELENAAEEAWALAAGIPDMIDIIFDYTGLPEMPRGGMKLVREGSFALPNIERVALVGEDPLIEMMFATMAQETYRPDPSVHKEVGEAASYLRRMAQEDRT